MLRLFAFHLCKYPEQGTYTSARWPMTNKSPSLTIQLHIQSKVAAPSRAVCIPTFSEHLQYPMTLVQCRQRHGTRICIPGSCFVCRPRDISILPSTLCNLTVPLNRMRRLRMHSRTAKVVCLRQPLPSCIYASSIRSAIMSSLPQTIPDYRNSLQAEAARSCIFLLANHEPKEEEGAGVVRWIQFDCSCE